MSQSNGPAFGGDYAIGDGFARLPPLTQAEVKRLESALGKPLDAKAQAQLIDALRILIVGTAKQRSAPQLKSYQGHLDKISSASAELLSALVGDGLQTTSLVRLELQKAMGGAAEFEAFLLNVGHARDCAQRAATNLRPRSAKRGPKERHIDGAFLRLIIEVARSVGTEVGLRHDDCDDGKNNLVNFSELALWLAVDRARAMPELSPDVIRDLESLHDRSGRALVDSLEKAMR